LTTNHLRACVLRIVLLAACVLVAATAAAPDNDGTIVVTSSRIRHPEIADTEPVVTTTADYLADERVGDLGQATIVQPHRPKILGHDHPALDQRPVWPPLGH